VGILTYRVVLSEAEYRILDVIRNLEWGKIEVVIQNGKPTILSARRDVKLS
jgi:hypothetical protein